MCTEATNRRIASAFIRFHSDVDFVLTAHLKRRALGVLHLAVAVGILLAQKQRTALDFHLADAGSTDPTPSRILRLRSRRAC